MKSKIEEIKAMLKSNLLLNTDLDDPTERLHQKLFALEQALNGLKELVAAGEFTDPDEEVFFFKFTKPEILAQMMEERLKYNLLLNKPIGPPDIQIKYFNEELNILQGFFRLNNFHYQYFKNNISELDYLFFTRNHTPLTLHLADVPDIDHKFSTPMSYLFAKFIAYQRVSYFLIDEIGRLAYPELRIGTNDPNMAELLWTGDAINIIELAYGIWLTGQLNHGNATLSQIVRWLEQNLKVTIGNIQSRFAEISSRKRLSPTKYIDQMKEAIIKKIDSHHS